ncbi:hypothetical protein LC085_07795 [Bacillus tianshenii]|uniref:hypothetical protein n=1 Tax=Sutcliffiella tianshenii TaxID=1463404 RepID=UPI001CD453BE|nr:hypothetical protein [Bacillus tianshenii]MCA1319814.1 hypothetical protein [Bacillus tianshenii]
MKQLKKKLIKKIKREATEQYIDYKKQKTKEKMQGKITAASGSLEESRSDLADNVHNKADEIKVKIQESLLKVKDKLQKVKEAGEALQGDTGNRKNSSDIKSYTQTNKVTDIKGMNAVKSNVEIPHASDTKGVK